MEFIRSALEAASVPSTSRRALLAGSLGGLAAAVGGVTAFREYSTRNHLRFRPLAAENESDAPVDLAVTVVDESDDRADTVHETTLAPADESDGLTDAPNEPTDESDASAVLRGPSVSYPAPYAIRARRTDDGGDGDALFLSNAAIVDRLPDVGWGPEFASVTVVVESDGGLSARVRRPRQRRD